jgi:hypothetical protein
MTPVLSFFFFFEVLGLELRAGLHLELLYQSYFCEGFFEIESCGTIYPGWLQTVILLMSAS